MRLSVIVPVYNTKKYLKQCLDSILYQRFQDIEIILVDDGSTDGSSEICNKYKKRDDRIQVIHQKNKGCLSARLCGFQNSHGDYIGFVDSDDWIARDMYPLLMGVAEERKCDIVSMGYTLVSEKDQLEYEDMTLYGLYEKGKNLNILLSNMMYDPLEDRRGIHSSLCSKVIKRELLTKAFHGIDENITMGEDAAVFYPCCLYAESIFIMKEYKYYYRIQNQSMCRTMDINTIFAIHSFYQYMCRVLSEHEDKYHLQEQLRKYMWSFMDSWLWEIFNLQTDKKYLFPYSVVDKNTDIILYGAGKIGHSYYKQIKKNHYCNIVAWIDKNSVGKRGVMAPDKILELDYCKIVVAIENKKVVDEIIDELLALGVEKERIVWNEPQKL